MPVVLEPLSHGSGRDIEVSPRYETRTVLLGRVEDSVHGLGPGGPWSQIGFGR